MNHRIEGVKTELKQYTDQIVNHPVYKNIRNINEVAVFMEHHIYAVWDFMSLLKALQINLTCTTLPWVPAGNPDLRYLINEIVTGEESDIDHNGIRKSHFELYLEAMEQTGASTVAIQKLLHRVNNSENLDQIISDESIPEKARDFMKNTFDVIATGKPHLIAAVFTFGREDLIPGMFHTIVGDMNNNFPGQISILKYYLDRHIEVDGDHHSDLALQMVSELCGDDDEKWKEAHDYSIKALQARIELWNGVAETISKN